MSGPSRRLLAVACSAAGRGWPVFPLQPYSKRPAIRAWPQYATTEADQLATWWDRAPYNVGIACGPAGLLVVDLDRRPAPRDLADSVPTSSTRLLAELARGAGAPDPRATYTVATPSGEHRYFAVPAVASNDVPDGQDRLRQVRSSGRTTVGALGPRIDTRAAGGYVAAAGSVRWVRGCRRYYSVVRSDPVAPAPPWLLDALTPAPSVRVGSTPVTQPGPYVRAAVSREAEVVREAEPGTRNSRLFGAAVRLGELAAAGLLTEQEVTGALLDAANRHVGVDGFTAAEADRTVGNGLTYGRRRPRGVPG
jgi:hypothetical protein